MENSLINYDKSYEISNVHVEIYLFIVFPLIYSTLGYFTADFSKIFDLSYEINPFYLWFARFSLGGFVSLCLLFPWFKLIQKKINKTSNPRYLWYLFLAVLCPVLLPTGPMLLFLLGNDHVPVIFNFFVHPVSEFRWLCLSTFIASVVSVILFYRYITTIAPSLKSGQNKRESNSKVNLTFIHSCSFRRFPIVFAIIAVIISILTQSPYDLFFYSIACFFHFYFLGFFLSTFIYFPALYLTVSLNRTKATSSFYWFIIPIIITSLFSCTIHHILALGTNGYFPEYNYLLHYYSDYYIEDMLSMRIIYVISAIITCVYTTIYFYKKSHLSNTEKE